MATLTDVHMPHLGVVEQATLTAWLVSPGDRVRESDPLCEVSTDKVDTEIASPASGVLIDYVAQLDDEVPVGAIIARFAPLDASDEEIAEAIRRSAQDPAATPAHATTEPQPDMAATTVADGEGQPRTPRPAPPVVEEPPDGASLVLRAAWLPAAPPAFDMPDRAGGAPATPLVRKMAKDLGLDLATIAGTGPGRRITRRDVDVARAAPPQPTRTAPAASPGHAGHHVPAGYETVDHEALPLSPQRRAIARNLVESVRTAPQVTAQVDVDMSAVTRARAALNERRAARGERRMGFLPFIARALCATIAEHPDLNATFTDTHLLRWRPVNLGVAVDAPHGLLVPVVWHADTLTVFALADALAGLAGRVHDRTIAAEDLTGGTITISNSGSVGGVTATPLLTPPQVASLGVPAIVRTPLAVTAPTGEEYVAIRPVARIGLSFDHRAFDGGQALRALQALQDRLQTWSADAYL